MPTFAGGEGQCKEWQTKFTNIMTQVRPGLRHVLRELENSKHEEWTEDHFNACVGDSGPEYGQTNEEF
eukprot:15411352-Alexandrium_andersonii.AAC.1